MGQSNNGTDMSSSHKEPQLDGDKHQGRNQSKISILAIIVFVLSILANILLGISLHRIRTDPGLDLVPLQYREYYDFIDNVCSVFGPVVVILSALVILRIRFSQGKVYGLRLAIASGVIAAVGYLLYWYMVIMGAKWNA